MLYLTYNNKIIDIPIGKGDEVYSKDYGEGIIKSVIYQPFMRESIITGFRVAFEKGVTIIVNRTDITVLKTKIF